MHNCDIICLSETYLTSTTDISDRNLKTPGYIMYRVDHPSDVERQSLYLFQNHAVIKSFIHKFSLEMH